MDCAALALPEVLTFLRRFLSRRLLPGEELDDALQDAALAVWSALPKFRGDSAFSTFAATVAWHTTLEQRRRCSRKRRIPQAIGVVTRADPEDPYEACVRNRVVGELEALMLYLSEPQAIALSLYHGEGCSIPEIAAMTGAPVDTVKSRLGSGRKRLLEMAAATPLLADLIVRAAHGAPERVAARVRPTRLRERAESCRSVHSDESADRHHPMATPTATNSS